MPSHEPSIFSPAPAGQWGTSLLNYYHRASKSPDFSGDLPIFDKIMKISRSPDLEWKSPDFLTKDYASTVDRQFCHSSRQIDCQFGEFCLKPFANCIVVDKNTACVFTAPGSRHIRRDTVVPHARAPGFCDRVTVLRPNPFIGYQSQRGR